jgi:ribosomal protein L24
MRGDHKGSEGKITRIDLRAYRIYLEGLTREKADGTTISVPVHPSKITITHLNLDDKWRKNILERKKAAYKKPRVAGKPEAKPEEKPLIVEEARVSAEEKVAAKEKPTRKRAVRRKPGKQPVTKKTRIEAEAAGKEKKQKTERKKAKRKTVKKAEKGEK